MGLKLNLNKEKLAELQQEAKSINKTESHLEEQAEPIETGFKLTFTNDKEYNLDDIILKNKRDNENAPLMIYVDVTNYNDEVIIKQITELMLTDYGIPFSDETYKTDIKNIPDYESVFLFYFNKYYRIYYNIRNKVKEGSISIDSAAERIVNQYDYEKKLLENNDYSYTYSNSRINNKPKVNYTMGTSIDNGEDGILNPPKKPVRYIYTNEDDFGNSYITLADEDGGYDTSKLVYFKKINGELLFSKDYNPLDPNNLELATSEEFNNLQITVDNLKNEVTDGFGELNNKIIELDNTKQDNLISGENIKTINNLSILGNGNIDLNQFYNTKEEITEELNKKQDTLISETNIKSINGESLLGSGTINLDERYYTETEVNDKLSEKQDNLISGENIKTINGNNILGSGNLDILLSESVNDAGFITKLVSDLEYYYTKLYIDELAQSAKDTSNNDKNYYNTSYVNNLENDLRNKISEIPKFEIKVVSELPTENISSSIIYLLTSGDETDNLYTEYIYINGKWEILGRQRLDLSGYVTVESFNQHKQEQEIINTDVSDKIDNLNNTKQDNLVSGTNIKTVDNQSVLGEGNLEVVNTKLLKYAGDAIQLGDESKILNINSKDLIVRVNSYKYVALMEEYPGDPNRKALRLNNNDTITGTTNDGSDGATLIMMNKWDVVDVGSPKYHTNINTKDYLLTVNDDSQVLISKEASGAENNVLVYAADGSVKSSNININDIQSGIAGSVNKIKIGETEYVPVNGVASLPEYPNYILPPATQTTLGGVKVGDGLDIAADGTISLYKAITINSFTNDINNILIGSTITEVQLTWTLNKLPVSLTLNGEVLDPTETSKSLTGQNITTNTTYKLVANDGKTTVNKSTSINFMNYVLYGTSIDFDENSMSKVLATSRVRSFTVDASDNKYIYYSIPSRLGTPVFFVGGFEGGFNLFKTYSWDNGTGYSEEFNVYKSTNANLGNTTVEVK